MKRLACLVALLIAAPAVAGDWPQFRGPNFNGSANETSLPTKWSTTENVKWAADLPGPSAATPAIWGNYVFVSSTDTDREMLVAMCFNRRTGKKLWSHDIAKGLRRASRSNFASPSPATDGKVVVFFYGNGDMVTYDFEGQKLWAKNIQKDYGWFHFGWTFSTSPVLYDGKLILQVLQRDTPVRKNESDGTNHDSFILAMDPATGKQLWKVLRPSQARAESREAFTTPTPFQVNGHAELLVIGGDALTGHDMKTGKELWRWGTWNPTRIGHWRHVPSPVANKDVVLVCAPKREPVYAIKTGGKGVLSEDAVAWKTSGARGGISSDVPTPALYEGDFFVLYGPNRGRPMLNRVDPKTGKAKWATAVPRGTKYEASPLAADGKIYLINFAGEVSIFDAESGKQINKISMDEGGGDLNRSSIIAARGNLFVRTNTKLYCIGK